VIFWVQDKKIHRVLRKPVPDKDGNGRKRKCADSKEKNVI